MTSSCGSIGLEGAEPILRKSDPWPFRTRRISPAHSRHHCRYDSRLSLSQYFTYLIPSLYGGDVTVMSTHLSGSCAIPATQSRTRSSCANKLNHSVAADFRTRTMLETNLFLSSKNYKASIFPRSRRSP